MKLLSDWFKKRKKVSREKAIERLLQLSRDMKRVKLDHYGNWTTDQHYLKLKREFDQLSEQLKEENGSR